MVMTNIFIYSTPIFMAFVILERFFYQKRYGSFPWKDVIASLLLGIIYLALTPYLQKPLQFIDAFIWSHRIFEFSMGTWWSWLVGFLAVEFSYYWMHRMGHEIRWLWASHATHHSPTTMTLSGSFRLGLTGNFSGFFLFYLPLIFLGFSPVFVGTILAFNLVYQFFLHTEFVPKLGILEHILNTPSHHRVHHSINDQYVDKNYGGMLIIFDRMFGTLAIDSEKEVLRYGLIGKEPSFNPLRLMFQEWIDIARDVNRASSLRNVWNYCFGRPGWKPAEATPSLEKPKALADSKQVLDAS